MWEQDRIAHPWGARTPCSPGEQWPPRVDMHLAEAITADDVERWVPSASVLHSNGDACDIAGRGRWIVGVRGRAGDRLDRDRLDPKNRYGRQADVSVDRLTTPLVRVDGERSRDRGDGAHDRAANELTRRCRPRVRAAAVRDRGGPHPTATVSRRCAATDSG
ncbi:hypothetical protein ACWEKR_04615 [Nocardia sp. NPDC004573]